MSQLDVLRLRHRIVPRGLPETRHSRPTAAATVVQDGTVENDAESDESDLTGTASKSYRRHLTA